MLQIPSEISKGVAAVPFEFFSDFISGEEHSVACQTVHVIAQGISAASLHDCYKYLRACAAEDSSPSGWSFLVLCGLHVEKFLTLTNALLRSAHSLVRYTAARVMLAAFCCNGALHHGLLHPLSFLQLAKTLREQISSASVRSDATDFSNEVLNDLELLLRNVPLRDHPHALSHIVAVLAHSAISSAPAFHLLTNCMSLTHGSLEKTASVVFYSLLPLLLLATEHGASRVGLVAQMKTAEFVCSVWESHCKDACEVSQQSILQVVLSLLEHASSCAPDQQEKRGRTCSLLSDLIFRFPAHLVAHYGIHLWTSSVTAGASSLMFCIQMASSILQAAVGREGAPFDCWQTPQILWRFIVKNCAYRGARVRSHALHCLAAVLRGLASSPQCVLLYQVQQPLASPIAPTTQLQLGSPALQKMLHTIAPSASPLEAAQQSAIMQAAVE